MDRKAAYQRRTAIPLRVRRWWTARIKRDDQGTVLPIMASLMLLATASGALAVDVVRAYALKSELQTAADSAALAAAIMLPDLDAARQAAKRAVLKNMPGYPDILRTDDFEFGHWQAESRSIVEDGGAASAVRVTVRRDESRGNGFASLFAGVLGEEMMDVAAGAVAGKRGVACLLAIDPAGKGLQLNKSADLELSACGAQVNSTGKHAFKASGKSQMISDGVCVSGGAMIDGHATVVPQPTEYCPPHVDPMQGLSLPDFGGCTDDKVVYTDETITLTSGRVFCGGLKITGNSRITLKPGLYVIDNGKFELKGSALLEGNGVTILLHGKKAEFDIKDEAAFRLTAPTDGPMKGLLLVQNEGAKKDNKWDSTAMSELTGVVYLPDGKFTSTIEANLTGTDACFVLIANEIKLDGGARMSIDLSSTACRESLPTAFSRAVALLD